MVGGQGGLKKVKKAFLNCLRVQIVPEYFEGERICNIADFCEKYGFRNVMLFINAEEYCVGHMTIEEAKPWVDTMKRAKRVLTERGISVSLNPWIEIGHLDRNRPLKPGQDFVTMVDYNGQKSQMVACPLCQNWRSYYAEFYTYLLRELEPEVMWVEDDFRIHNHAPLAYGGCFCDEHMRRYNAKLGKNYTREQFVQQLFEKGDMKVRKAWLDVNRSAMVDLAEYLGKVVYAATGGKTKVGLMSSMHQQHATEGRDWYGIHKGLAQGGEMIDRLHLPSYQEISSKQYYYNFNLVPYIGRVFLPRQCSVLPELENGSFNTFTKEARFLQFQLESAIPLCIDGMTYDIFDFVGNGTVEATGYGQAVKQIEPYLNAVMALSLKYETLEGVVCPVDEKTVYHRKNVKDLASLYPDENDFYAYLNAVGFTTKITKGKRFRGKTVALSGGAVYNFTDEQLENLFAQNFVIVEGGAAIALIERGLGYLIKAQSYRRYDRECELSYEQPSADMRINGISGYRATMFFRAGSYVQIEYCKPVRALSHVYDYQNRLVGCGDVYEQNFLLIPFVINTLLLEQFHDLRTTMLRNAVLERTTCIVSTGYAGVYAYLYRRKREDVLILVNSTVSDMERITLQVKGVDRQRVFLIDRKNGKRRKARFHMEGDQLTLNHALDSMTTCTLVLG